MRLTLIFLIVLTQVAYAQEAERKKQKNAPKYPLELSLSTTPQTSYFIQQKVSSVLPQNFNPENISLQTLPKTSPQSDIISVISLPLNLSSGYDPLLIENTQQRSYMIGGQKATSRHIYDVSNVLKSSEFTIQLGKKK